VLRIDPATNTIVASFPVPGCTAVAGIDINPKDNLALLGCTGPQTLMNLNDGSIVMQYPNFITATDVVAFDPSIDEWFTASSNNTTPLDSCPASSNNAGLFPVVGIFFDPNTYNNASPQFVCSGQGSHGLGVDPLNNTVYVPVGVFPASGGALPAGISLAAAPAFAGVVVFQAVPEPNSLLLLAFGLISVVTYTSYRRSVQK